jgi:hypothetical protein
MNKLFDFQLRNELRTNRKKKKSQEEVNRRVLFSFIVEINRKENEKLHKYEKSGFKIFYYLSTNILSLID